MINNQNIPVICALATPSHLHLALTMADSFISHHPNGKVFMLQVGGEESSFPSEREYLSVIYLSDLDAESEINSMQERYSTFEFCNALKPYLLKYVLENTDYKKICYFDSDLFVLGNMESQVWEKLEDCSVMLTPHYIRVTEKNDEETFQKELNTIIRGVYNAGFVGIRRDENARKFINWWKEKVFRGCYKRPEEGMYVDQRWLDIIPSFDINTKINHHPGLNVAFWNLSERTLALENDEYLVNGKPLLFFHISGYSPDKPDSVSKLYAMEFADFPYLREIFDDYRERLIKTKRELEQQLMKRILSEDFSHLAQEPNPEPSISVVISAENKENYVSQSIKSVLQQTLTVTEIFIIDSPLSDKIREKIEGYGEKVSLITDGASIAAARNKALKRAKGEFIIFLEAGDYFLFPTVLEEQIAGFQDKTRAITLSGWRKIYENNDKSNDYLSWQNIPALTLKYWLQINFIQPSTIIFRREALIETGGFKAELFPVEFWEAVLQILHNGYTAGWLKRVTVASHQSAERSSKTVELCAQAIEKVHQSFFENGNLNPEIKQLAEKARFESKVQLAYGFYQTGNFPVMKAQLLESLKHTKLSGRGALVFWFSKLLRIAREERLSFDAFELINKREWHELEELLFEKKSEPEKSLTAAAAQPQQFAAIVSQRENSPLKASESNSESDKALDYAPKINLTYAASRFVGKHRSGWNFALQSLLPLHTDAGIYFDGASDATFDTGEQNFQTDLKKGWLGVFHNPPALPEWLLPEQRQKAILESKAFQDSLGYCRGIFCLSKTHRDWLAKQIDVPVAALYHPTETPDVKFSLERFAANPEKRVVQIGHWGRKLHSIYFLPTIFKRCLVYQDFDFVRELFDVEKNIYNFRIYERDVKVLPFLDEFEYDNLLAENLVYIELYDASANNTVIECIVRNTPILVNPLPAVREYLGEDYPFYFESRMQAAAKAEDFGLIAETHEYLKNLDIKQKLTGEYFLKSFAESDIYQKLL